VIGLKPLDMCSLPGSFHIICMLISEPRVSSMVCMGSVFGVIEVVECLINEKKRIKKGGKESILSIAPKGLGTVKLGQAYL
jgi:hypothetical protein